MTTPTPAPGATPTPTGRGAQARVDAGVLAPVGGVGGKSQFGLGQLSGAPIVLGGLLPVTPNADGTVTAEDVLKAFATAPAPLVAQIQHLLMLGGFYSSKSSVPNYGVLNKDDIDAFTQATSTAAQTGADLNEYLQRQAKFGEYTGAAAAAVQKAQVIQKADPLALAGLIDQEFKKLTGKKATPQERAGFIAAYNATFTAKQNADYAAQTAAQGPVGDPNYNTAPVQAFDPLKIGPDRAEALNAQVDQSNLMAEPTAPATPAAVTTQDFDPSAFAEQYVRENAGASTGAHDLSNQFQSFLSILGGIK
jgi:hypothetical protein